VSPALPTFSVTKIIDLRFTAVVRGAPGHGVLRFKVFTPGGFLYQSLAAPFVVQQGGGHEQIPSQVVEGFPPPAREQGAQPASPDDHTRHLVSASLPVAGTLIATNGLYGRWRVEPWLDGSRAPCGSGKAFVVTQ